MAGTTSTTTTPNPGDNGLFQTLGPLFDPGYKVVFKVPTGLASATPPAFSDPRGVPPPGLVPASQLSYEILDDVLESVIPDLNAAANTATALSLTGGLFGGFANPVAQVTVQVQTTTCIVVFQGHDVVDLPTLGLPTSNGGIVVPQNVFMPIYAGGKFLGPNDDFSTKVSQEFIKPSSGNGVAGVVPSANSPLDCLANPKNIFNGFSYFRNVDTASNTIKTKGAAQFLTYVAADKLLYRDVIHMNSSAIAQGTTFGDKLTINFAGPFGDPVVRVFRYAFININTDPKTPPIMQWRLSESFGVTAPNVTKTPDNLLKQLTADQITQDFVDDKSQHYAYNLNDATQDITTRYIPLPNKPAFSINLANAKMNPKSAFFDKNFKAQIIPFAKNESFFQSRLQTKAVFGLTPEEAGPNTIRTMRDYQSPAHTVTLDQNARIGVEYSLHKFSHVNVFIPNNAVILASTVPAADGISTIHDPCFAGTWVFVSEDGTATKRLIDDDSWTISKFSIPPSTLSAFLIGDSPFVSSGYTAILPQEGPIKNVKASGVSGKVTVPSASSASNFIVSNPNPDPKAEKQPVLQLFADSSGKGTPVFEVAIPKGLSIRLEIPPVSFQSFSILNPAGAKVTEINGVTKASFLEAMVLLSQPTTPYAKLTNLQLAQIKAQDFPVPSNSVTAATLETKGYQVLAFENNGRIDMAYRSCGINPFLMVRDVTFRVPEGLTDGQLSNAQSSNTPTQAAQTPPSVSLPLLLSNIGNLTVLLFYVYKNRLLCKSVPIEIFTSRGADDAGNGRYKVATESGIISDLQTMIPTVVYDGNLKDRTTGMKADIKYKTVNLIIDPNASTTNTTTTAASIAQYSGCRTNKGYVYLFIEDNNRIRARRSNDDGRSWTDVFTTDAIFLPPVPKDTTGSPSDTSTTTVTDGSSPSCFFDIGQGSILFFFFVDNSLLYMSIPEEILRLSPADATTALGKILPQVVYGKLSDNLKKRGVVQQQAVINRQAAAKDQFNEALSPHRLAVIRSNAGHLRVFFSDQQKILRSLISTDGGKNWVTEDQYIAQTITATNS